MKLSLLAGLNARRRSGSGAPANPALTLRAQIEALASTSVTGRQSTEPLTSVNLASLPAGMSWRADTEQLTITATDTDYTDWDFRGYHVNVSGQRLNFVNCLFGHHPTGTNYGGLYDVWIRKTAEDILFDRVTFDNGAHLGRGKTIVIDTGAPNSATGLTLRLCRLDNVRADQIIGGGSNGLLDRCYFGPPLNVPPGTPIYDPASTYSTDDLVLFPIPTDPGIYRMYRALQNVPINEQPTGTTVNTAYWRLLDIHFDGLQWFDIDNWEIRDCYFDHRVADVTEAVGVQGTIFRGQPATDKLRYFTNLRISGVVMATPAGSLATSTFGNNIREWSATIAYGAYTTDTNSRVYCRTGDVIWRSLLTNNVNNAPASSPTYWEPTRDFGQFGPQFFDHIWSADGREGKNDLFGPNANAPAVGTIFRTSNNTEMAPLDVNTDDDAAAFVPIIPQTVPTFGVARAALPARVSHGPASRFTITPTGWVQVAHSGGIVSSAFPVYIGGVGLALIFEDGSAPLVRDRSGITVTKSGSDYIVNVFNHAGNPMTASLDVCYGAATVVTGTATGTGPAWGVSTITLAVLSGLALTSGGTSSLDWTVNTDTVDGTIYAVLLPSSEPAPSAGEVVAGLNGEGGPADFKAEITVTLGTHGGTFTGLQPATTYTIYVAQKVGANISILASTTGFTDTDAVFFTTPAAGTAWFVDPANSVPTGTTRIRHKVRMAVPSSVASITGARLITAQESTGFDVDLTVNGGNTLIRLAKIEDDVGGADITPVEPRTIWLGERNRWITLEYYADWTLAEFGFSLDGEPFTILPMTGSPTQAEPGREISYLANTAGGSAMPEGVQFEYIETYFTTSGVETLRKRVAGDAATVNADAWKQGAGSFT